MKTSSCRVHRAQGTDKVYGGAKRCWSLLQGLSLLWATLLSARARDLAEELAAERAARAAADERGASLKGRPSAKQWRAAERTISELEGRLAETTDAARRAARTSALRRYVGTAELVRRDKLDYALSLQDLDALPKAVAVECVRELCRDLKLQDVADVAPAVRKLSEATLRLPRLLKFAVDACALLRVSAPVGRGPPLEAALDAIEAASLGSLETAALVEDVSAARDALRRRGFFLSENVEGPRGDGAAVRAGVDALLHQVAKRDAKFDLLKACDGYVADRPGETCARLLAHAKAALGAATVAGVVPALEKVLARRAELETFARAAGDRLGVEPPVKPTKILGALDVLRAAAMPGAARSGADEVVARSDVDEILAAVAAA